MVQTCIVHLIRAATRGKFYQDRKRVSSALREVYTAVNEDAARAGLDVLEASEIGQKYPQWSKSGVMCGGSSERSVLTLIAQP